MIFTKVVLSGYKRLMLNKINYIEITLKNKIHLILGTNGSGKSSLIKEMTPLPGTPGDYVKDGFKEVHITHNNSNYVLSSIFSTGGNKFHFIKDNEELNPGHTSSVYKELVKKEFNVTQDIHDLMTGVNNFHSMSVSERRAWFTKLSFCDYTYAVKYYNKLKEQHRDLTGSVKLLNNRLVTENEKLLTAEGELTCREEISALQLLMNSFLDSKVTVFDSKNDILNNIRNNEQKLKELTSLLRKETSIYSKSKQYNSLHEMDEDILLFKNRAAVLSHSIHQAYTELSSNTELIESLRRNSSSSLSEVEQQLKELNEELHINKGRLNTKLTINDVKLFDNSLNTVYDNLVDIFSNIEINQDRRYTRETFQNYSQLDQQYTGSITHTEDQIQLLTLKKKELEHLKMHGLTSCPKCEHQWYLDFDEKTYNKVLSDIRLLNTHLDKLTNESKANKQLLEATTDYLNTYKRYLGISSQWPELNPLWGFLVTSNIILERPKSAIKYLENLKIDLVILLKIETLKQKTQECEKLKELLSNTHDCSLSKLIENQGTKEIELVKLKKEEEEIKHLIVSTELFKRTYVSMNNCIMEIESTVRTNSLNSESLVTHLKNETLNDIIYLIKVELTKREQLISKVDIQKALILNLETQVKEHTEKHEILKLAIDELSPTKGLIARGLTGFINHFILQLNSFIKKIWLYPLEIMPIVCDEEDDSVDLDYKFTVQVNGSEIIPDISKMSSGMIEVVDLAFKVVSAQYLGLADSPLYLDEFAVRMDAAHRQSANYVITNLLTTSDFSQIFMISHYENSYGSLKNTDITVLCPGNVVIPEGMVFNNNVIMR